VLEPGPRDSPSHRKGKNWRRLSALRVSVGVLVIAKGRFRSTHPSVSVVGCPPTDFGSGVAYAGDCLLLVLQTQRWRADSPANCTALRIRKEAEQGAAAASPPMVAATAPLGPMVSHHRGSSWELLEAATTNGLPVPPGRP